ncbi:hypothetical protein GEMRC1_001528 [Eukaryota sp. GEM-RC1]
MNKVRFIELCSCEFIVHSSLFYVNQLIMSSNQSRFAGGSTAMITDFTWGSGIIQHNTTIIGNVNLIGNDNIRTMKILDEHCQLSFLSEVVVPSSTILYGSEQSIIIFNSSKIIFETDIQLLCLYNQTNCFVRNFGHMILNHSEIYFESEFLNQGYLSISNSLIYLNNTVLLESNVLVYQSHVLSTSDLVFDNNYNLLCSDSVLQTFQNNSNLLFYTGLSEFSNCQFDTPGFVMFDQFYHVSNLSDIVLNVADLYFNRHYFGHLHLNRLEVFNGNVYLRTYSDVSVGDLLLKGNLFGPSLLNISNLDWCSGSLSDNLYVKLLNSSSCSCSECPNDHLISNNSSLSILGSLIQTFPLVLSSSSSFSNLNSVVLTIGDDVYSSNDDDVTLQNSGLITFVPSSIFKSHVIFDVFLTNVFGSIVFDVDVILTKGALTTGYWFLLPNHYLIIKENLYLDPGMLFLLISPPYTWMIVFYFRVATLLSLTS